MRLIVSLLSTALRLYSYVMLIYCLMSWFPMVRDSQLGQLISRLAEPVLMPIRSKLSRYFRGSMFDWSPMVVFLAINILNAVLVGLL